MTNSICEAFHSAYVPIEENAPVICIGSLSEAPIYGSKISDWDENGEEFSIWYLTFGEEVAEETPEEMLTVTELLQQRPILSDFLHLEADFCFIIEADGSYDVFKDS